MNTSLANILYLLMAWCALWLGLLGAARLLAGKPAPWAKILLGAGAALLLFIPTGDQPLWNRMFSFYPNPSLPSMGILALALWQQLTGRASFKAADWRATWVFGALAGSALYLHQLVFDRLDLYYWGWSRDGALVVVASAAIVLVALGNRLGLLLLAALIAYAVNAIESHNAWDYIMDPIYWVFSMIVITRQLALRLRDRRRTTRRSHISRNPVVTAASARDKIPYPARVKKTEAFAFTPPPPGEH